MEKLPIGPHNPYPGPTFPIHVITAVIVVSKSRLFTVALADPPVMISGSFSALGVQFNSI